MKNARTIVSCTTTAKRLGMLFYVIESIKKQLLLPNKIQVNISNNPYLSDAGIKEVPDWLSHELVDLKWVDNTGPFRKLLPTINSCNDDDVVITMDDDVIYHPEWLSSLLQSASTHSDCIVCARGRYIKKSFLGGYQNYTNWHLSTKESLAMNILPIGVSGVVYRRSLLDLDFINDPRFLEISPTADDLWYRMASIRKGVYVYVNPEINAGNIHLLHNDGLEKTNISRGRKSMVNKVYHRTVGYCRDLMGFDYYENDRAWTRIREYSRHWGSPNVSEIKEKIMK